MVSQGNLGVFQVHSYSKGDMILSQDDIWY